MVTLSEIKNEIPKLNNENEIILTDPNGFEVGDIKKEISGDFDVGIKNDFSIKIKKKKNIKWDWENCRIFVPDTEFGGLIKRFCTGNDEEITIEGLSWRGRLHKKIIKPPQGASHLILNGD